MSKDNQRKKAKSVAKADDLAKTGSRNGIELTEHELDKVSGGPTAVEMKWLKID